MHLDFSNTSKVRQHIIRAICMISATMILAGCGRKLVESEHSDELLPNREAMIEQGDFYAIYKYANDDDSDTYMYEICDFNGNIIVRDILYRLPRITIYNERYIEVRWGAGTGVWLCRYYDLDTYFTTQGIECARYINDGIIGRVAEDDTGRYLRLFNPFSYSNYNKTISLDFDCNNVIPSSCLIRIEMIEEGTIQVEYWNSEGEVSIENIVIDK